MGFISWDLWRWGRCVYLKTMGKENVLLIIQYVFCFQQSSSQRGLKCEDMPDDSKSIIPLPRPTMFCVVGTLYFLICFHVVYSWFRLLGLHAGPKDLLLLFFSLFFEGSSITPGDWELSCLRFLTGYFHCKSIWSLPLKKIAAPINSYFYKILWLGLLPGM